MDEPVRGARVSPPAIYDARLEQLELHVAELLQWRDRQRAAPRSDSREHDDDFLARGMAMLSEAMIRMPPPERARAVRALQQIAERFAVQR
jgi:hypothetical protein